MRKLLLCTLIFYFGIVGSAYADIFNGHDYYVIDKNGLTWEEAKAAAEKLGGHLATIGDQAEWEFIKALLEGNVSRYYLGGYQDTSSPDYVAADDNDDGDPKSAWTWIDGTPWFFDAWGDWEPNDGEYIEDGTENYLMTCDGNTIWNDGSSGTSGFILEIDDAALLYFEDFENAVDLANWNTTHGSLQVTHNGVMNNNVLGSDATYSAGFFNNNETVTLSLDSVAPGTYEVQFDLYVIYTWDGEVGEPDSFIFSINGDELLNETFNDDTYYRELVEPFITWEFDGSTDDQSDHQTGDEMIVQVWIYPLEFEFVHNGGNLNFSFIGNTDQAGDTLWGSSFPDEPWALDNFVLLNTGTVVNALESESGDSVEVLTLASPPGVKGMINKLSGKGGVVKKVKDAVEKYESDSVAYLDKLDDALEKLDAYDTQLSDKISKDQIIEPEASYLQGYSANMRTMINNLINDVSN